MRIEGNVTLVVCDENTEKGFWQSFCHQIGCIAVFEDNTQLTERYVYYDAKTGHLFDIQYTKK